MNENIVCEKAVILSMGDELTMWVVKPVDIVTTDYWNQASVAANLTVATNRTARICTENHEELL